MRWGAGGRGQRQDSIAITPTTFGSLPTNAVSVKNPGSVFLKANLETVHPVPDSQVVPHNAVSFSDRLPVECQILRESTHAHPVGAIESPCVFQRRPLY